MIKDKIVELCLILNQIDEFENNISSTDQYYDFKISDLYHKLENMKLSSKKCYRLCREFQQVLKERREYKNNLATFYEFKKNISKLTNGIENRNVLVSKVCSEDKKVRNSIYHNRIYEETELNNLIGEDSIEK